MDIQFDWNYINYGYKTCQDPSFSISLLHTLSLANRLISVFFYADESGVGSRRCFKAFASYFRENVFVNHTKLKYSSCLPKVLYFKPSLLET